MDSTQGKPTLKNQARTSSGRELRSLRALRPCALTLAFENEKKFRLDYHGDRADHLFIVCRPIQNHRATPFHGLRERRIDRFRDVTWFQLEYQGTHRIDREIKIIRVRFHCIWKSLRLASSERYRPSNRSRRFHGRVRRRDFNLLIRDLRPAFHGRTRSKITHRRIPPREIPVFPLFAQVSLFTDG